MTTCFQVDDYCDHEQSLFRSSGRRGRVVCTKNPRETPYMPWALRVNPRLFVIYVLRDPRGVIVSKHKKFPDSYYSNLQIWKENEVYRKRLEQHKRFLVVKYEDLVSEPDNVQERIEAFLPFLKKKSLFSSFHLHATPSESTSVALGGLRPISSNRLREWENHLPRIRAQLERFGDVSSELVDLGYESDLAWKERLDAVEPNHFDSLADKTYRSVWTWKMQYRIFRKVAVYAFNRLF